MTIGEKIKEARKKAGLSQEQFAEKMNVSRSAVAKWETDKGIPDIGNLKVMSKLLNVSIDHLLDDGESPEFGEMTEPVNLADYEKTGRCRNKQDAVCLAKFADADMIYPLIRTKKMSRGEAIIDFLVAPGVVQGLDYAKENPECYLVEKSGKQYLVKITKDFIKTSELAEKVDPRGFVIGSYKYRKVRHSFGG